MLGWILVDLGEPQRALRYLRDAQARMSHDPNVAYHLAVALHDLGRLDEAKENLERALSSPHTYESMNEARRLHT